MDAFALLQNEIIPQTLPMRSSRPFYSEDYAYPQVTLRYNGQEGVPLVAVLADGGLLELDASNEQDIFMYFQIVPKVAYRLEVRPRLPCYYVKSELSAVARIRFVCQT